MRLYEAAKPIFARHETFHPRYGWFRKAYTTAATTHDGFSTDDAPVNLGVGKNMVRSIKFWGQAAKVITKDPDSVNQRAPEMIPTRFGHALFDPVDGWDPFMEDPGTIWLLHWMLLAPPCHVPVWWVVFNELHAVDFDDSVLEAVMGAQLDATSAWASPNPSSIGKDISVLMRTYAPAVKSGRAVFDDLLDCPLRELGLINHSVATGNHRFVLGAKPTLPDDIVTFSTLDYLTRREHSGSTITLAHLANEPGGPGRAFKLSEQDLHVALSQTATRIEALELLSPTGAQQLSWNAPPGQVAVEVLNSYFDKESSLDEAGLSSGESLDLSLLPNRGSASALVGAR